MLNYLYQHIRLDTNEIFYIGIGKMNTRRAWEKRKRNKFWNNIINKTEYKVEIILEDLDDFQANKKEIEFIELYGRRIKGSGTLVNVQPGGKDHSGYKLSKEQKEHISNIHKNNKHSLGYKHTEEAKKRMSITRKGRLGPNKGKTFSEEVKRKMSDGHKGNLSHTGKICINDGIKNTYILKDNPIPDGWIRGKVKSPNLGRKKNIIK